MLRTLGLAALAALALALPGAAGPVRLAPADPQPEAAALKPGLAVRYAFPGDIRQLAQAETWRGQELTPGQPLVGFDYPDTRPGEPVLTSGQSERVIAFIDGYMRFDAPGTWRLEFHSNDGLEVRLAGQVVYRHDGRHPCETEGWVEVEVPEAGWYAVSALYFQRLQTACLMLKWQRPGGAAEWTPTGVYGHR